MKRLILTLSILSALGAVAYAGPETYSGKEMKDMKEVAPAPPACPSWTGFYLGGNIGYAFAADADITLKLGGSWNGPFLADILDKRFIEPLGSRELHGDGLRAGGALGYNYQFGHFVVGVEADIDYVGLDDSHSIGPVTNPATGDIFRINTSYNTNYIATFGPRFGYAWCRFLPYVTGGLAIGDIDFYQRIHETVIFTDGDGEAPAPLQAINGFPFDEQGRSNDTQVGWFAGGGLQYAITDHWSARAEYRYTDLGCTDFDSAGKGPNLGLPASSYTGNHELCLTFHSVTFGVLYKF